MASEILLAKLQSGEEVIGRIKSETDTTYKLAHAKILMVQPDERGEMKIGMIPWMLGAPESDVILEKSMISGRVPNLPKNLEDGFLQQTSGISFATAGAGKLV